MPKHERTDALLIQLGDNAAVLRAIHQLGDTMSATLQEIKAEIVQIRAGIDTANASNAGVVAALKAKVAELEAKLAAGTTVTQQDLEDIDAGLDDIIAAQGGTVPVPPTGV